MAIGAARVMAAGKAGLQSLPYFVDELRLQGIQQLAPWAADHSNDQIEELHQSIRGTNADDPVPEKWGKIYGIGHTPPGTNMEQNNPQTQRLLHHVNKLAAATPELPDSPAQLAAWCRFHIWEYCRETIQLWNNFKYHNGIVGNYHLAVVIPYCPEGPTSGTVGMYLGAALRQTFSEMGLAHELVVWGIELCPPPRDNNAGDIDAIAMRNIFRGYVARQELLDGVPLSEDPEDETRCQPFDVNIVFDGGATVPQPPADEEDVWRALDRSAAQATACLLNGAVGGDEPESTAHLKEGPRWNAYLVHVVSEFAYNPACRYLRYRVMLPWHRDPDAWESASISDRKDAFVRRMEEIERLLESENDKSVKGIFEGFVDLSAELQQIKGDRSVFRFINKPHHMVRAKLEQAMLDDEYHYNQLKETNLPEDITPRMDPFCINNALPEGLRQEGMTRLRDADNAPHISSTWGTTGCDLVRRRIEAQCADVLKRPDCQPHDINSQALFVEMCAISIANGDGVAGPNDPFKPSPEFLRDFITEQSRVVPGAFTELHHELSPNVAVSNTTSQDRLYGASGLGWRSKQVDYDVPVEYSFLTLARVRHEGKAFDDVSTYPAMEKHYHDIIRDPSRHRDLARYYGAGLPPILRQQGDL